MSQSQRTQRFSKVNVLREPTKYSKKKYERKQKRKSLLFQSAASSIERKNIDTFIGVTAPAAGTWSVATLVNPIVQGSSQIQRIGRKTTMTSVQMRYNLVRSGSNGPSQIRIVIIYDKQNSGSAAAPATLDIFAQDTSVSPLNMANSERFVVVMDEMSDSMQSTSLNISGYRYKKIGLDTIWTGAGGALSNIVTGSLLVYIANNDVTTGSIALNADMFLRVRYTDA